MPIVYKRSESPQFDLSAPTQVQHHDRNEVDDHEDEFDFLSVAALPFSVRAVAPAPRPKRPRLDTKLTSASKSDTSNSERKKNGKPVSPTTPKIPAREIHGASNANGGARKRSLGNASTKSRNSASSTRQWREQRHLEQVQYADLPHSSSGRSFPTPSASPRDLEPARLPSSQQRSRPRPSQQQQQQQQQHPRPSSLHRTSTSYDEEEPDADDRVSLVTSSAEKELRPRGSLHPPDRELKLPPLDLGASRPTSTRHAPLLHKRPPMPAPATTETLTARRSDHRPRRATVSAPRVDGHGGPTPSRPQAAIAAATERRNVGSASRDQRRGLPSSPDHNNVVVEEPRHRSPASMPRRHRPSATQAPAHARQDSPPPVFPPMTSSPTRVPDVPVFLASLPLPLGHLAPTLAAFGLSSRADLLALAARSEGGAKARRVIMDELERRGDVTPWQRIVVEAELEVVARTWSV